MLYAGDTLALIRGTETFLMDLLESPEWIARSVRQVSEELVRVTTDLWPLVSPAETWIDGYASTAGIWSDEINVCTDLLGTEQNGETLRKITFSFTTKESRHNPRFSRRGS